MASTAAPSSGMARDELVEARLTHSVIGDSIGYSAATRRPSSNRHIRFDPFLPPHPADPSS